MLVSLCNLTDCVLGMIFLQDKGVLLTTYDIVRNNSNALQGGCNRDHEWDEDSIWDYIILDEVICFA